MFYLINHSNVIYFKRVLLFFLFSFMRLTHSAGGHTANTHNTTWHTSRNTNAQQKVSARLKCQRVLSHPSSSDTQVPTSENTNPKIATRGAQNRRRTNRRRSLSSHHSSNTSVREDAERKRLVITGEKKSFHRGRKFQILTPWNRKETSVQSSRSVSRWWNQDIQDVFGAKPSEHCRDGCNRKPWKDLRTDWSSGSVRTPAAELWMNRNQTDTLESPSPLLLLQPSAAVACLNF